MGAAESQAGKMSGRRSPGERWQPETESKLWGKYCDEQSSGCRASPNAVAALWLDLGKGNSSLLDKEADAAFLKHFVPACLWNIEVPLLCCKMVFCSLTEQKPGLLWPYFAIWHPELACGNRGLKIHFSSIAGEGDLCPRVEAFMFAWCHSRHRIWTRARKPLDVKRESRQMDLPAAASCPSGSGGYGGSFLSFEPCGSWRVDTLGCTKSNIQHRRYAPTLHIFGEEIWFYAKIKTCCKQEDSARGLVKWACVPPGWWAGTPLPAEMLRQSCEPSWAGLYLGPCTRTSLTQAGAEGTLFVSYVQMTKWPAINRSNKHRAISTQPRLVPTPVMEHLPTRFPPSPAKPSTNQVTYGGTPAAGSPRAALPGLPAPVWGLKCRGSSARAHRIMRDPRPLRAPTPGSASSLRQQQHRTAAAVGRLQRV